MLLANEIKKIFLNREKFFQAVYFHQFYLLSDFKGSTMFFLGWGGGGGGELTI